MSERTTVGEIRIAKQSFTRSSKARRCTRLPQCDDRRSNAGEAETAPVKHLKILSWAMPKRADCIVGDRCTSSICKTCPYPGE